MDANLLKLAAFGQQVLDLARQFEPQVTHATIESTVEKEHVEKEHNVRSPKKIITIAEGVEQIRQLHHNVAMGVLEPASLAAKMAWVTMMINPEDRAKFRAETASFRKTKVA